MRPIEDDRAIWIVREAIPQFEGCYYELREMYGEDLTAGVVFLELAEFVEWLVEDDEDPDLIERCFSAVEQVATAKGVDVLEVVGYSFLDGLRPDTLEQCLDYLGPTTERVLESLGGAVSGWSHLLTAEEVENIEELVAQGLVADVQATPTRATSSQFD